MAFTANGIGDRAKRNDQAEAGDDKDRFDFHKFAFIRVQLNPPCNSGPLPRRAVRKITTKDMSMRGMGD